MRPWFALVTVALAAAVTTAGLWIQEHREAEDVAVAISIQQRSTALHVTPSASSGLGGGRPGSDLASLIEMRQLASARPYVVVAPTPPLRAGTVLPALAMVGLALAAVRLVENRRTEG